MSQLPPQPQPQVIIQQVPAQRGCFSTLFIIIGVVAVIAILIGGAYIFTESRNAGVMRALADSNKNPVSTFIDSALILGTWENDPVEMSGMIMGARTTFSSDGSFTQLGSVEHRGEQQNYSCSGQWSFDGVYLSYTITQSSAPTLMPSGMSMRERVISLKGDVWVTEEPTTHVRITARRVY